MQTISQLRSATPKETKRFIKFLIVGALGFAVDFGSFNLFHALGVGKELAKSLFPVWGYLNQHPEIIEQTLSVSLAILSNFVWNYFWIYPEAQTESPFKKFGQFLLVTLIGLLIGLPVFALGLELGQWLVEMFNLKNFPINVAGNFALICRVGVVLFWNFFANRYWTYRKVK